MEKDQEPPFPRESWQRLLQDRADAPSETTDLRILAAARKAVTPKPRRWWLPASLAASVLLAVVIVQSQYGNGKKPDVVLDAQFTSPAASVAPPAQSPDFARARAADSAAPEGNESAPSELHYNVPLEEFAVESEAEEDLGEVGATGSRIRGPEQELKAASDPDVENVEQSVAPRADAPRQAAEHPSGFTGGAIAAQPVAKARTPEAWYADIEALRKAGRIEEADAELARFEAAHPDWLEQHDRLKP